MRGGGIKEGSEGQSWEIRILDVWKIPCWGLGKVILTERLKPVPPGKR